MPTHSEARRPRSPRGEGEQLRAALLRAAESLLVEPRSAPPLSLREVARLAGVSPSAVYLHFDSAQQLIEAVVDLQSESLVAAVLGEGAPVTVAEIAERYVEWGLANPGAYQLLFESADRLGNPVGPSQPGWVLIEAAVVAIRASGGSEADAATRAMRAWAALHGIVSLRIHKGDVLWATSARDDALAAVAGLG